MKSGYDMSRVHRANPTILKETDRVCRKYNVRYMLNAGTLIGAVRHKGFIPWDDGADMAFTKNRHDASMKVVKRKFLQGLELVEPGSLRNGRGSYNFMARIVYKNSRYHEGSPQMRFCEGKLNHLWVDLFVIDRLPAGRTGISITRLLRMTVYGMAMGHRYGLDFKKYSLANRIFMSILAGAGQYAPMETIFSMQRVLTLEDRKSKGRLHYYSSYQPNFLYAAVDRGRYDSMEDAPLEDTRLMIPRGWHGVLILLYGDYMRLPPGEQRVLAHSSVEIEVLDQGESKNCSGSK